VSLEHVEDRAFGFLRVGVRATKITCEFNAVDLEAGTAHVADTITIAPSVTLAASPLVRPRFDSANPRFMWVDRAFTRKR
jgi:hypothetical protein